MKRLALALTAAGVIWLDPSGAALVLPGAILLVGLALAAQPALAEQTLRFRTHAGVLGRVYHDALLGAVPIRTHGAALAVRREHEHLLVEWFRTGLALLRAHRRPCDRGRRGHKRCERRQEREEGGGHRRRRTARRRASGSRYPTTAHDASTVLCA